MRFVAVLDKRTRDDPRRQATERAFLDATKGLLDDGAPFAELTVSRIAERAGRTRSAFYVHFEDRRQLLLALLRDAGVVAIDSLGPFLVGDGPIGRDEVESATRALLGTFREHATLVRAVVEATGYDEQIADQWSAIIKRIIDGSATRLSDAGITVDVAAQAATALVWMTERTCYQQAVRGDTELDDAQVATGLSNVWWSFILTAATPAP